MSTPPLKLNLPENSATYGLARNSYSVAAIAALLWDYATQSDIHRTLVNSGLQTDSGKAFTSADVKLAVQDLRQRALIDFEPGNRSSPACRLVDELRIPLYRELLQANPGESLVSLIATTFRYNPAHTSYYWGLGKRETIAYLRIKYFSGASSEELSRLGQVISRLGDWDDVFYLAIFAGFDGPTFAYLQPNVRSFLTYLAISTVCTHWTTAYLPIVDWAIEQLDQPDNGLGEDTRQAIADLAFQRDDSNLLETLIAGHDDGLSSGLRAAQLVMAGEWAAGQAAFEQAFKKRKAEIGGSKRFLPDSYVWLYPLALLAQGTPKHIELARKFCAGEAGRREPSPFSEWGRWVHAIDFRLGKAALIRETFFPPASAEKTWTFSILWALLLTAWVGPEALQMPGKKVDLRSLWQPTLKNLRQKMATIGVRQWLPLLDGAETVLAGRQPPPGFFIAHAGEQWRDILAALQALSDPDSATATSSTSTRLVWEIDFDKQGALLSIKAYEQKRGPRGWGRPRPISLNRIASDQQLPNWDAKVARTLRPERSYSNRYSIDLAAAIVALVGHPCVVLANALEQFVELVEAAPELELVRQGDRFVMRIDPPLRAASEFLQYALDAEERRELEALRLITLIPDGAQRLRLVRFNAAQQQAAMLVSGHFGVPADASDAAGELEKTLRALSGQFQVHAEPAQATRQVACDTRLRAELSPLGEHLMLRLVAAPLGTDGPRLPAASGRRRVIGVIDNETVGTERDLAGERANLEAVLDALPFLDGESGSSEWAVEDPELALQMIEMLPTLPAIAAVDWPKGKSVRVLTADSRQLSVRVSHERDWFRVGGSLQVDEGLVLQLEALLEAARGQSRFIPMGDGVYAALTRSLKQKLNDLAAVLEADKAGNKAPLIAASWLDEVLDGTELEASRDFRQAIDRLQQAQATQHKIPGLLQTRLRPYQEDGYQWAMRLASAGLGGCLADDMGLGKTLQSLAVLLERATGGAALIIAPTSVCGNWLAEIGRFAPTLQARLYADAGETDRDELINNAGPQDVLIVSYTLLQLGQENFARRTWHTVIADEAQAIKNAAAKRSQATFELPADFRLALTGTPVENRLTDLWSIMRFANPGLLGSVTRFNERFAGPIERQRDREAQHILKRLVGPFVLRRTKSEVLQDLPARTELILRITPESAEAAHYEALRRQATDEIDATLAQTPSTQATFNILAQLTRLRRAACDPRLSSPQFGIAGAKVQAFAELANELLANGHKALVFSQFVDFLQLLREPLDAAGIVYQYLDGATPAGERSKRVQAFQNGEGDLFLISLKAGGFGLNLTAADYVVITDPWWNPAAEDQATGRAHRIGQSRPVTVYRLVTSDTVEERIVELHHEKRALADGILAEGEASDLPSAEDLIALIRGK